MYEALAYPLIVALGGAIGGVARYGISGLVARRWGDAFPWGTLAVNVTGAATIGGLAALVPLPDDPAAGNGLWLLLAIGILGSYTTVSSFSLQTLALAQSGQTERALANIAVSLLACLTAVLAGYAAMSGLAALWGR